MGWQAALVGTQRILVNGSDPQGVLKVCFGEIHARIYLSS